MKKIFFKNKYFDNKQKGMTLIELMVVIAIFMIVSGIIMFDYNGFRSNVSIQNLADDIALSIRSVQNYAIGVQSSQSSQFSKGYGIHFSTAATAIYPLAGYNKSFIVYNDLNNNNYYDYSTSASVCNTTTLANGNECINMINITSNDYISQICSGTGSNSCNHTSVNINFLRPNPDATICLDSPNPCTISNGVSNVDIIIKNAQSNATKTISVSNVGQISVK
ncbi:MAG: prepilin-type N-terminal cleavage/methylation domain-containing protein [Patescibacteria group bacterium]|nr:prepilin-type N-terminal cleavage/methylation domain-containing protein [Patescibacteria group bacterium]